MELRPEQSALILVVDDEPDIRRIIRILLESSGYQVAEAPNGLAAVEYIRKQPNVDLVLMDIMMPQLGGVEASRAIRERCAVLPDRAAFPADNRARTPARTRRRRSSTSAACGSRP